MKRALVIVAAGAAFVASPAIAREPVLVQPAILYLGSGQPDWEKIELANRSCDDATQMMPSGQRRWQFFYNCVETVLSVGYEIIYPQDGSFPTITNSRARLIQPGVIYMGRGDSRGERYSAARQSCRITAMNEEDPDRNVSVYYGCLEQTLEPSYAFVNPLN